MGSRLNTIELFAGCGGLVDGFEKTGKYKTLACVEWNDKPYEVLKKRLKTKYGYKNTDEIVLKFDIQRTSELIDGWKDDLEYGSNLGLRKIIGNNKVDLIVGGPPCQAYSMAGRVQDENGMRDDYRNYLFESYIEVVKCFKPKVIVFENVEGILSAKPGGINIIDKITEEFLKAGYVITNNIRKNALLDLSEFGIAQKRKRVILLGLNKNVFGEECNDILNEFYNEQLIKFKVSKKVTVKDVIGDLPKLMPRDSEKKVGKKKYSHFPDATI